MITANYKFTKTDAEKFIAEKIRKIPTNSGISINVEIEEVEGVNVPSPIVNPTYPDVFLTNASACPLMVLRILKREGKIPAIRELRTITNCGLKDAKDYVENLQGILNIF